MESLPKKEIFPTQSNELQLREEQLTPKVEALYKKFIGEPIIVEALNLLDKLPPDLVYHNRKHTESVIWETILFAVADGKEKDEKLIRQQAIAAAWHDVGFLREEEDVTKRKDAGLYAEESRAIDLLKASKLFTSLSHEDKWETIGNIWDTRVLPRKNALTKRVSLHLEKSNVSKYGYMLDGDVSNFGSDDFIDRLEEVAEERGKDLTDPEVARQFYENTISLLENHEWKTNSAARLRGKGKEKNLKELHERLAELSPKNDSSST
jgi:hypothetical protein